MAGKEKAERSRLNVFVRCRPHLAHDVSQESLLSFPSKQEVFVSDDVHHQIRYKFDHVFPPDETLPGVFEVVGEPLVSSVLSGVSSCLMAYGQLSTGKTYNMLSEGSGIVHKSIETIFERIDECSKYTYKVLFSFLQIYQDRIYDLLTKQNQKNTSLVLREHPKDGVIIEGLTTEMIEELQQAERLLKIGKQRLVVTQNSKTLQLQSRSHTICIIQVEKSKKQSNFESTLDRMMTKNGKIKGRLFMCDLAGSERLNKSGVSRRHVEEARYINTSLLELGNVIHALSSRSNLYVPFRNSTLTRILKESLGGNSKASLMVCISPATSDLLETKYSLNFGQRAMKIVKHTMMNVEPRTDSHWLNYPLFRRRKTKKIDYRKLAEYLTNKLKELETAYNSEKDNLRSLKRKLAKKRSDFIRNKATESESESNESTPSKITTTRKLSILLEESTSKEVGLSNPALDSFSDSMTVHETHYEYFIHPNKANSHAQTIAPSNQVNEIATQTYHPELVSCYTSNPCLYDDMLFKEKCMDKAVGTSSQTVFQENIDSRHQHQTSISTSYHSLTNLTKSIATNTSLQEIHKITSTTSRSVNTSLQSIINCGLESSSEQFTDTAITTSSTSSTHSLKMNDKTRKTSVSSTTQLKCELVSTECQTDPIESVLGTEIDDSNSAAIELHHDSTMKQVPITNNVGETDTIENLYRTDEIPDSNVIIELQTDIQKNVSSTTVTQQFLSRGVNRVDETSITVVNDSDVESNDGIVNIPNEISQNTRQLSPNTDERIAVKNISKDDSESNTVVLYKDIETKPNQTLPTSNCSFCNDSSAQIENTKQTDNNITVANETESTLLCRSGDLNVHQELEHESPKTEISINVVPTVESYDNYCGNEIDILDIVDERSKQNQVLGHGDILERPRSQRTQILSLSPINIHEFVDDDRVAGGIEHTSDISESRAMDLSDCGVISPILESLAIITGENDGIGEVTESRQERDLVDCGIWSPLLDDLSIITDETVRYSEQQPSSISQHSTPVKTSNLMLVNYKCSDADSEISLREAKILQSPKDIEHEPVTGTSTRLDMRSYPVFGQSQNLPSLPVSPFQTYPYSSIEAETESIYREDTRYARKSLQKAQHRYSALFQQLEFLVSNEIFVQDSDDIKENQNSECHDIILKFKTELEDELGRAKNKLQKPDTLKMPESYHSSGTARKSNTGVISCIENTASVEPVSSDRRKTPVVDSGSMAGSSSGSDQTPSGVFEDDFIGKSRDIIEEEVNVCEERYLVESAPPQSYLKVSRMEGQISPDKTPTKENKTKTQLDDEKFLKQRKLTLAAIENAEIKKELLLTKLEKLRLEAVLSCVLIDTESNDMTKEFQQLSMRSMKCLTSSKSTLASATSCAHLPSVTSPVSAFKSLQSPKKKYKYRERFIGADHIVNDVKKAGKISLIDEASGVTRSVQTEKNVVDWLNSDHVTAKKAFEEASECQSSSEFDVSSISDLGSPLLLARRLSPCGQDNSSPYSPHDYIFDTDFDEVDKLLMRYKKKKSSSFSLSCFPFMRNKKQKLRDNLQTGSTKLTSTELNTDC